MQRPSLLAVLTVFTTVPLSAQTPSPTEGSVPTAASEDVGTIDGIIAALYDVISGPAGEQRDWVRFRSLFVPEAKFLPTFFPEGEDQGRIRILGVDEFATQSWTYFQENTNKEFYRFAEIGGRRIIRYAKADRLRSGCVDCMSGAFWRLSRQ